MARSAVQQRRAPRLGFALWVVAVGWGALVVAQGPGEFTTYAGYSSWATALGVGAGLALTLAGLVVVLGRSSRLIGDLTLLAAFLWFAPIYVGWNGGPPLVRSFAMVMAGFTFPVLAHLLLAYPSGRMEEPISRLLVRVAYAEAALVALGWALFADPFFDPTCWANCTDNVFLFRSRPSLARAIEAMDRWFSIGSATALAAICLWRLRGVSGPARRALLPVFTPAILVAASSAGYGMAQLSIRLENPSEPIFLGVFVVACSAVIVLAAGLVWGALRTRLQRVAVARIVTSLGEAPPPGSLESALARAIGDQDLQIAYPLSGEHRLIDANGRPVAGLAGAPARAITTLVRNERPVALVSHAAGLPTIESELGPAVRLALENERLQAESLAQVDALRASRRRIIETGDAERRRMERDLHDGAQQRLLAVSYDIRLARAAAEAEGEGQISPLLADALAGAQAALDELRELAQGIYPAILEEAGLASALASLADTAPVHVVTRDVPDERYPPPVETAVYLLVVDALEDAADRGATYVTVAAARVGDRLIMNVEDDGRERTSSMAPATDRIGALGGTLHVASRALQAEIPCA